MPEQNARLAAAAPLPAAVAVTASLMLAQLFKRAGSAYRAKVGRELSAHGASMPPVRAALPAAITVGLRDAQPGRSGSGPLGPNTSRP
eukprot:scaffold2619_cov123-Isochrysis_galbana.AAC.11